MLKLRADMATNLSVQSDARAKALKKEALAYAKKVLLSLIHISEPTRPY